MSSSNPFRVGDKVRKIGDPSKKDGEVKYITCRNATSSGGKTCDKKNCQHYIKDFVFVKWPDGSIASYNHSELNFDANEELKEEPKKSAPVSELQKAKEAIKEVIAEKNKDIDFSFYNGFKQIRHDRAGRQVVIEYPDPSDKTENSKPPIELKDINWEDYTGKRNS